MARRCFEVKEVEITFPNPKKEVDVEGVLEKFKKYLKKYASSNRVAESKSYKEFGMTELHIRLENGLSANTINNILNQMAADTDDWYQTLYNGTSKKMTVRVMG